MTGTIVPKWDWYNCSQVRLVQLFPSDTGKTVPKAEWQVLNWDWYKYSQVTLAYYKTTDHWQVTDHRKPTHRQVLYWPPKSDPPTSAPPTHRPTDKCFTDPPTINSQTGPPPTHRSPIHQPYYKWPTTHWVTNLILTGSLLDQFL